MYGRAEGDAGDLLAEIGGHEKAFIATKVWTRGREPGIDQMKQSMRLLKAGRIDLMQVHNLLDWEIHLETLRAWRPEGRIRYIGITHYTPGAFADLARVIEAEPIDFLQIPYSIGVRDAEDRLLPLAAERGVAVFVNEPYDGGSLFRSVRGHKLPPVAAEFGCASWGQYFLKFILGHPAVTCVIPGTSKPKHLHDNLAAGRGRLPEGAERGRMGAAWRGA